MFYYFHNLLNQRPFEIHYAKICEIPTMLNNLYVSKSKHLPTAPFISFTSIGLVLDENSRCYNTYYINISYNYF